MSRPLRANACASAAPIGSTVRIADEEAVIVWDEATHTEHFIRGATFDTAAHDFGYIVPTPNTPELAEAQEVAFDNLREIIRPKIVYRPLRGFRLASLWQGDFSQRMDDEATSAKPAMGNAAASAASDVDVVRTQRVAGYDVVVLAADDADALNRWLRDHGYATRPALTEWLQPYVAAHWKVTAFKIAQGGHQPQVSSALVRMSFHTDRPFFPYREPADQRTPGVVQEPRSLRVFMLSASRTQGKLDLDAKTAMTIEWPGQVTWANRLQTTSWSATACDAVSLELALHPGTVTRAMWLTTFEDNSSPRPGVADLYFSPAVTQATVEPPPIIVTSGDERVKVPIELLGILLVAIVGCGVWLVRARTGGTAERV